MASTCVDGVCSGGVASGADAAWSAVESMGCVMVDFWLTTSSTGLSPEEEKEREERERGMSKKKVKTLKPPPEPTIKPDWSKHHGHTEPTFGCYDCVQLNKKMWVCVCLCPNIEVEKVCKACGESRSATTRKCKCECQRKSHKQMKGQCKNCSCKKFEPANRSGGAR